MMVRGADTFSIHADGHGDGSHITQPGILLRTRAEFERVNPARMRALFSRASLMSIHRLRQRWMTSTDHNANIPEAEARP